MEENRERTGYSRYLSRTDVWGIAFGCIVGWGAFVMPGTTFIPVAGPLGTLIAMMISAGIMLMIGLNYSFLMVRRPGTGGVYAYTKEAFGRDHAFLCSWFLCLSYLTIVFLNATAIFIVVRTLFNDILQIGPHYVIGGNNIYPGEVALSAAALAGVGLLFIKARPFLQRLHTILALALIAGVLLLTAACLPQIRFAGMSGLFGIQKLNPVYAVFSIVLLSPWAFVGFDVISLETVHFSFPIKKSKRIIILSILLAAFVYAALSLISVSALPEGYESWQGYFGSLDSEIGLVSVPTFYAARAILGKPGLVLIGITAAAAILTGMIAAYRAATRMLSTMAEDRILSEKFLETPYTILFIMVISIMIAFLGRNALNWFVELTSFGAIIGFGYTSAAAWKMARMERNRTIIFTGFTGALITVVFAFVELIPHLTALETMGAESFLLLSLWCLLGFVFYWRTVNNTALSQYSGMSTSGIVLFALLLYSALMWFAQRLLAAGTYEKVLGMMKREGIVLLIVIFIGLVVMLYVQNLVREKHEILEREKIHAVESSLAKSRFLFNMSHDIRTPMNAIIGYTNLAQKENRSPEIGEYLSKIESSSQHLLSLINDVLEMSRIESGTIELEYAPLDICRLLSEMDDLFSEQMREKDMEFSVYTSQVKNRFVWCDGKNLNRVLLNILSNAYKFTPAGGTVSVSLWEIGNGENGYGSYELRIRDSGIGMSREFTEKMFTAFERERTSTVSGVEGTGLGLAITKSIVDLMNGTIEVITSPGSGTEFIIRLKLRLAKESDLKKEEEKNAPKPEEDTVDFSEKRLLLVEDNMVNREIATMILTQAGFSIETAENGKIALDMVKDSAPGYYDAILMDIQMPEMDGYEATRAIRALPDEELARIPIVAMTANAFREDEIAAAEAGMQAHIAKPLDVDKMMGTLREVLK